MLRVLFARVDRRIADLMLARARISRAVSQSGILAVGDLTPDEAVTFQLGHHGLWNGIPPVDVLQALETYVSEQVEIAE